MRTNTFRNISLKLLERYSSRYDKFGYDVKTLGWGSAEQQEYRFLQTLQMGYDFSGKRIVDFGCGFGDFAGFLKKEKVDFSSYIGLDLNPKLVQEAMQKYREIPNISFDVLDLATQSDLAFCGDVGVMIGMLNFNLEPEGVDNYIYADEILRKAFDHVSEVLIVDFISIYREDSYPVEDFIFYYDPSRILQQAFKISHNVSMRHNYYPIPQKEFMILMSKEYNP